MIQRMLFSNYKVHVVSMDDSRPSNEGTRTDGSYLVSAPLDGSRYLLLSVNIAGTSVSVTTKIRKSARFGSDALEISSRELPELYRALFVYYTMGRTKDPSELGVRMLASRAVKDCSWLEHDFSFKRQRR